MSVLKVVNPIVWMDSLEMFGREVCICFCSAGLYMNETYILFYSFLNNIFQIFTANAPHKQHNYSQLSQTITRITRYVLRHQQYHYWKTRTYITPFRERNLYFILLSTTQTRQNLHILFIRYIVHTQNTSTIYPHIQRISLHT